MSDPEPDVWIEEVAQELRRPVRLRSSFDRRVMAAVRDVDRKRFASDADDKPGLRRGWSVSITLTPLRALAVAAGLAAVAVGSGWVLSREPGGGPPRGAMSWAEAPAATSSSYPVQFVVVAPDAAEVTLVGDFNDWDSAATPMRLESPGGVWSVTVPLPAGRYQYAFVVDGQEWRVDPGAPAAAVDDFGAPNSILAVTEQTS